MINLCYFEIMQQRIFETGPVTFQFNVTNIKKYKSHLTLFILLFSLEVQISIDIEIYITLLGMESIPLYM